MTRPTPRHGRVRRAHRPMLRAILAVAAFGAGLGILAGSVAGAMSVAAVGTPHGLRAPACDGIVFDDPTVDVCGVEVRP